MFWKKSDPREPKESLIAFLDEKKAALDPAQELANSLRNYEDAFYDQARGQTDEVERAKKVVAEANKIVGEGRLGAALVPVLLGHVLYWPAWAVNGQLANVETEPLRYISGLQDQSERVKITIVSFAYKDTLYTVCLHDEGMYQWATDDMNVHGKVELFWKETLALALDVSKDLSKSYPEWRWSEVAAFQPGAWMKDLIEMSSLISAAKERRLYKLYEDDLIARAKQIQLP
jgi:hypothetical protein